MNQQPTILALWGAAIGLGLVGYWVARFRRVLILPVLGAIVYLAWTRLGALADPVAGPPIIQKVGYGYLVQACGAVALAVVLSLMGLAPKRSAG
jgi:hypothetical protein